MNFAEVFSGLRRERGLTQKQAAEDMGISQALLSHYEKGIREPRLDFIEKACEYYGVSADYMLGMSSAKLPTMRYGLDAQEELPEFWNSEKAEDVSQAVSLLINNACKAQCADEAASAITALCAAELCVFTDNSDSAENGALLESAAKLNEARVARKIRLLPNDALSGLAERTEEFISRIKEQLG